jgi:hypothetical protein
MLAEYSPRCKEERKGVSTRRRVENKVLCNKTAAHLEDVSHRDRLNCARRRERKERDETKGEGGEGGREKGQLESDQVALLTRRTKL